MAERKISIEELLRRLGEEGGIAPIPSEGTVQAYLSGTANELEIQQVREAALSHPRFRQDLIDLGGLLETLEDPATSAAFDRAPPGRAPSLESVQGGDDRSSGSPARDSERPSWIDRLFGGLPRPAIAFALVVLVAAPVAWLALRGEPSVFVDPAPGAVIFTLREMPEMTFRDGEELPAKELAIGAGVQQVDLRLRAPRGSEPGKLWDVTLTDASGSAWRQNAMSAEVRDAVLVLRLGLDPARLAAGEAEIRLSRPKEPASEVVYRFRLRKD